jgi:adenylate cyclase
MKFFRSGTRIPGRTMGKRHWAPRALDHAQWSPNTTQDGHQAAREPGHGIRLPAILAADAAGYSCLMAADERATLAILDAARTVFRKHIESNQGRVIDMAGDSVLAVFGASAHALLAAMAVQCELHAKSRAVRDDQRMRFRIGVHLSDVIEKVDGTVYGHGINVSARLEGLAEPGGIAVSDAIRNTVRGAVGARFADMGMQSVKNIAEPLRVYRVVAASPQEAPARPSSHAKIGLEPSARVLPFTRIQRSS